MPMFSSNNSQGQARRVLASFTSRETAEAARSEVVKTGVSYEAIKITDGIGSVVGQNQAHPFVVTAHVAQGDYSKVAEILGKHGVVAP